MSKKIALVTVGMAAMVCTGCSWMGVLTGVGAAGGIFEVIQLVASLFGTQVAPGV